MEAAPRRHGFSAIALAGLLALGFADPAAATTVLLDPPGESGPGARDIASVSAGFDGTSLVLGVSFVTPPSFDDVAVRFQVDTDADTRSDFAIFFNPLASATQVFVIDLSAASVVGTGSVVFGGSTLSAMVARSLLGGASAVLFGAESGFPLAPDAIGADPVIGGIVRSDGAPTPPGGEPLDLVLGGPATAIPEPTTALLLAFGLAGLARRSV